MTGPGIASIDHLLTYVPSLEQASEALERLGFRLSPISRIDEMGISNRMALMRPRGHGRANYIEFMSPHDPAHLPDAMRALLHGEAGTRSMVLASEDLPALQARMASADLPVSEPFHVRREWRVPGEPSLYPEFDVILPIPVPLTFNACRYEDATLYTREDWLQHPNGAQRVSTVLTTAANPADLAYLDAVFGGAPESLDDGSRLYRTGEIDLMVMAPETAAARFGLADLPASPAYFGYVVEVVSLEAIRSRLSAHAIPAIEVMDGLAISAHHGCGNVILFREP